MDELSGRLPVARVLMCLGEARASGTLHVLAGTRRVSLRLRDGRLYTVEGTGHLTLGDMLLRARGGEHAFGRAIVDLPPHDQVGSCLVERGVVSATELCAGLRALHLERLTWLFRHVELRLVAQQPLGAGERGLRASTPLIAAVPKALGAACAIDPRALQPSLSGRREAQGARSFALLAQKRRAAARGADAAQLLDLPRGAGRLDAQRRLRSLARAVHPDLFRSTHPTLAEEADKVLATLTRAAARYATVR
jgi:hypothetical protein